MRRVLTPVRSEEEIRVPYNQNPLRVWVVLNTQGALIEFVDKFLSLMSFNINDGNRR